MKQYCIKYKYLYLSLLLVSVLFTAVFTMLYLDFTNELEESKIKSAETIVETIQNGYLTTIAEMNHFIEINTAVIRDIGKNITNKEFNKFNQLSESPFLDELDNIRFSPLIYNEELAAHEAFGRSDIGDTYQINQVGPAIGVNISRETIISNPFLYLFIMLIQMISFLSPFLDLIFTTFQIQKLGFLMNFFILKALLLVNQSRS